MDGVYAGLDSVRVGAYHGGGARSTLGRCEGRWIHCNRRRKSDGDVRVYQPHGSMVIALPLLWKWYASTLLVRVSGVFVSSLNRVDEGRVPWYLLAIPKELHTFLPENARFCVRLPACKSFGHSVSRRPCCSRRARKHLHCTCSIIPNGPITITTAITTTPDTDTNKYGL
jgi:hypothetical protein